MKLSKEFYEYMVSLVNNGYKVADINNLLSFSNILIISTGNITIGCESLLNLVYKKDDRTSLVIVSQQDRVEQIKNEKPRLGKYLYNWNGKYTISIIDKLEKDNINIRFDAFLYFGLTPVSESNMNILEIADSVINDENGKGCFVYSFSNGKLYEYSNIHKFYSAMEINKHVNKLLNHENVSEET